MVCARGLLDRTMCEWVVNDVCVSVISEGPSVITLSNLTKPQ